MEQRKVVLVVDDEPKIAQIVLSYLAQRGYDGVWAPDGHQALALFERHRPALVILDLMLPGMPGEDVCRAIREKSRVPIIMLTAKTAEESILEGLGIGADDYVVKPFSPRQLMARVEAVLRRAPPEDPSPADRLTFQGGDLVIDTLRHEVRRGQRPVALTPTEFDLLLTLARRPGRAFTREELILQALGEGYEGFDRVIDSHIKNIRRKLEDDPRAPRYIRTIHGVGYSFGGEP